MRVSISIAKAIGSYLTNYSLVKTLCNKTQDADYRIKLFVLSLPFLCVGLFCAVNKHLHSRGLTIIQGMNLNKCVFFKFKADSDPSPAAVSIEGRSPQNQPQINEDPRPIAEPPAPTTSNKHAWLFNSLMQKSIKKVFGMSPEELPDSNIIISEKNIAELEDPNSELYKNLPTISLTKSHQNKPHILLKILVNNEFQLMIFHPHSENSCLYGNGFYPFTRDPIASPDGKVELSGDHALFWKVLLAGEAFVVNKVPERSYQLPPDHPLLLKSQGNLLVRMIYRMLSIKFI